MTTSRTALVTGSTSGIGDAVARTLAAQGLQVVVTGRDADRGADVVREIGAAGGSAVFVPSDLAAPPADVRAFAAAATEAAGGRIDVLVHNAGILFQADTPGLTDEQFEATVAVNIRAPHVLTAALAPAMAARGDGAIVVIGSWMARLGFPALGVYTASKAAEEELARSWSAEFGPRGVRVNTVAPGATRTPINDDAADVVAAMTSHLPGARPAAPQDIADAVAWLVSDHAQYVHGATIPVDGGILSTRTL